MEESLLGNGVREFMEFICVEGLALTVRGDADSVDMDEFHEIFA